MYFTLKEVLRDPVWGGLGGLIALIGLAYAFWPSPAMCEVPILSTLTDVQQCGFDMETVVVEPAKILSCRKPEFGIERYVQSEVVSQSSGWVGGGSNPTNWCNQMINSFVSAREIGETAVSNVTNKSEQGRWTGIRKRQYNYSCTATINWSPLYIEKAHSSCGSTAPITEVKKIARTCEIETGRKTVECPI